MDCLHVSWAIKGSGAAEGQRAVSDCPLTSSEGISEWYNSAKVPHVLHYPLSPARCQQKWNPNTEVHTSLSATGPGACYADCIEVWNVVKWPILEIFVHIYLNICTLTYIYVHSLHISIYICIYVFIDIYLYVYVFHVVTISINCI